jgi:predicted HTH domain antitoxin
MATVNVDLPTDLVSVAKLDQGNVSQEAAKFIALELFREGTVSLGRAAELCATPLAAFMNFAAARGVPPLN